MTTTFTVPTSTMTPCQEHPEVFFCDELEIDTSDGTWHTLTVQEKLRRMSAQEAAENRAVQLCRTCPVLDECSQWAQNTRARIFGVVGGLLPRERTHYDIPIYVMDHERDRRGRVRSDNVRRLLRMGHTHQQIATALACSPHTIARIANRTPQEDTTMTDTALSSDIVFPGDITRPKTEHKKAQSTFKPESLSPESQKIYEYLSDGQWHSREDLLHDLLTEIPVDTAEGFAPKNRTYATSEQKQAAGARRFLLNRLDIAQRRGRMESRKLSDGEVLIRLSESVAMAWGHADAISSQ